MNKRKRKNSLKPFPLTRKFPKTVKVPGAWAWRKIDGEINKKTYTEEEIQLQQEEDRILKGWKTIKDPDARELGGTYKALELIRNPELIYFLICLFHAHLKIGTRKNKIFTA